MKQTLRKRVPMRERSTQNSCKVFYVKGIYVFVAGEMAVVHKTVLLNTMLCACRDDDPLIRTSALSNLAEITLVLHYKIGNIIYEVCFIKSLL